MPLPLEIVFSRDAAKYLERLPPKHARQVATKIAALGETPQPPDSIAMKGKAHDYRRADSGEYRIIYRIIYHTVGAVLMIAAVGKRNDDDVYRRFERKL